MKKIEFITSYKFATISNIIYSGVFTDEQINDLNISNFDIVEKNQDFKYIKVKEFELNENSIIFSRTEDIPSLFYSLKKIDFKNITLITHQSDINVSIKHTNKIPACINNWFSVNVSTNHNKLRSIPIGLANNHPKNLNEKDFDFSNISYLKYFKQKNLKSLIYLNFQKSTNFKERDGLFELFLNKDWAKLELPKHDKKIYIENLKNINFTLTPHGNGRDTHRFWESLYSGSIPVVREHIAYSYAKDLPVLFVKDYKEVTQEKLIKFLNESNENDFNLQKLDFNYWRSEINGEEPDKSKTVILKTNSFRFFIFDLNYKIKHRFNSYKKILIYYFRKVKLFLKSE